MILRRLYSYYDLKSTVFYCELNWRIASKSLPLALNLKDFGQLGEVSTDG